MSLGRMVYQAKATITFEVEVEVCQNDLNIIEAEAVLKNKASQLAKLKYGYAAKEIEVSDVRGVAVDHLPKDQKKYYERMILAGRFH